MAGKPAIGEHLAGASPACFTFGDEQVLDKMGKRKPLFCGLLSQAKYLCMILMRPSCD
jgi:hypothetical protein